MGVSDSSKLEPPPFTEFFNPTLKALRSLGGSGTIEEIVNRVIQQMELPDEIVGRLHGEGPQTEVEYRLAWSRTYLKRFGLLENSSKGVWALTPVASKIEEVETKKVVAHYHEYLAKGSSNGPNGDGEEKWREELLDLLLKLSPDTFERLCQRLLRESGFIEVEVTGRSGDGGIDGHGILRLANLVSFPILFQCKRYKGTVVPSQVRDFRGAMTGRADKGLIITTGSFTKDARREATREGAPPIDLIDGDHLIDILTQLELGVRIRKVEVVEIDNKWFEHL